MGGKTAMQFALQHPDKVRKLIVVDIAPKAYNSGFEQIFAGLKAIKPSTLESREEADEKLAEYISEWGVRQFLLKNLARNKDGSYSWKMNLPVLAASHDNVLEPLDAEGPVEVPTLAIRGGKSNYIADSDRELRNQ